MDMMQTVIKREFEKASNLTVTQVIFGEDETITVSTDSEGDFVMQIGSDDDEFKFAGVDQPDDTDFIVSFPFPPDWWDAVDENNFS